LLLEAIAQEFPSDIVALRPGGGFFVWCKLPPDISAKALLTAANEHGISFLPGTRCYANGQGDDAIRLSISLQPTEKIVEGIAVLGTVLRGWR
ncbi:MAG: PLP-dependent aminotransferase family protein, partial [Nostoc sp.]